MIEAVEDITLVGTVHVSPKSVAQVEETIRRLRPAKVYVELDADRLKALEDPEAWKRTDMVRIIREGKQHLFLAHVVLASFQHQIAEQTGVKPGTELLRAVQVGREVGAEVVLMDRNIAVTLRRCLSELGFWGKVRTLFSFWAQIAVPSNEPAPANVEDLLKTDALTAMTDEMGRRAPTFKRVLLDERDQFMASHLRPVLGSTPKGEMSTQPAPEAGGEAVQVPETQAVVEPGVPGGIVAVVGAGHVQGMKRILANHESLPTRESLEVLRKPKVPLGKIIGWSIPLLLVGFFVYLGATGQVEKLWRELGWFVLVTGSFSAAGALLAGGHPLSILTAFFAAPIGVLHPLLATGWFSGIVEAKVRGPTVGDFEGLKGVKTARDVWGNRVWRVLLVTGFTNLGAMISTGVIGKRIFDALGG